MKIFQFDARLGPLLAIYLLRMRKNGHFSTFDQILTENLKFLWSDSYSTTKFGGTFGKIYAYLDQKTAFVMQNFENFGLGEGGTHTCTRPPKGESSANFPRFEPLVV